VQSRGIGVVPCSQALARSVRQWAGPCRREGICDGRSRRVDTHRGRMAMHLDHIHQLDPMILSLDKEVDRLMAPLLSGGGLGGQLRGSASSRDGRCCRTESHRNPSGGSAASQVHEESVAQTTISKVGCVASGRH
jgi:hypothetical protein